eukprot:SAG11_NODE_7284_length_1166_cov_1.844424_2_plen_337_part_01
MSCAHQAANRLRVQNVQQASSSHGRTALLLFSAKKTKKLLTVAMQQRDGVICQSKCIQLREHPPNPVVQPTDRRKVGMAGQLLHLVRQGQRRDYKMRRQQQRTALANLGIKIDDWMENNLWLDSIMPHLRNVLRKEPGYYTLDLKQMVEIVKADEKANPQRTKEPSWEKNYQYTPNRLARNYALRAKPVVGKRNRFKVDNSALATNMSVNFRTGKGKGTGYGNRRSNYGKGRGTGNWQSRGPPMYGAKGMRNPNQKSSGRAPSSKDMEKYYDQRTWKIRAPNGKVNSNLDPRKYPQAFQNDKYQGSPYCIFCKTTGHTANRWDKLQEKRREGNCALR